MKVKWLSSAEHDTDHIVDSINPHNPDAARRVISEIQQAIERLGLYPFVGRPGMVTSTRELVVPRTPYIVIYSVEHEHIAIKRVLHTSQQWPPSDD